MAKLTSLDTFLESKVFKEIRLENEENARDVPALNPAMISMVELLAQPAAEKRFFEF